MNVYSSILLLWLCCVAASGTATFSIIRKAPSPEEMNPFGIVEGVEDCGSAGELIQARVTDCVLSPCDVIVGKVYVVEIDFIASDTHPFLHLKVDLGHLGETYTIADVDIPDSGVEAGLTYTFRFNMPIGDEFKGFSSLTIQLIGGVSTKVEVCGTAGVTVRAATSCGGSLQANLGILDFADDGNYSSARTCIWILRLLTRSPFALQQVSIGQGTSVGIFSTDQAQTTFPIVAPLFTFNGTTEDGSIVFPAGEMMLLVMPPSETRRSFSIGWAGLINESFVPKEAVNYFDQDDGEFVGNDVDATTMAFLVNTPSGYSVNVSARVLGFEDGCADLAYSIFEVNAVGNLREVARTCGRPVTLQNLQTPLVAFVAKADRAQTEFINLKWTSIIPGALPKTGIQQTTSTPCGGSLQANEGNIFYDEDSRDAGRACVWILRLVTRSLFAIHLHDISSPLSVSIFSTEQAGSASIIVEPKYIFNASLIDETFYPEGQILIIVLPPGSVAVKRSFSITWYAMVNDVSISTEAANYLDTNVGAIQMNNEDASILAYVVNPPNGLNLNVEVKVIGSEESCANLAYSIYEINPVGNLREVARTCGRPVSLVNLKPPLVAFIAKADARDADPISIRWDTLSTAQKALA